MTFRFPEDVNGWLTEREGRKLAELAAGKRVLEIGSYEGRSTVCIAQAAARVECIDPCDGRATPGVRDTEEAFVENLCRYGVRDRVRLHVGTTAERAPDLAPGFDLAFIDGDHSLAAVREDIRHALALLAPGGLLAFHDYDDHQNPDVTAAVHEVLADGGELCEVADTLAVVRPGARRRPGRPVVFLAMPRRGLLASFGACEGYHLWPTTGGCEVVRSHTTCSILDHAFNRLWASALNLRGRGVTHLALIHDDVCPGQGWLDVLLSEMARLRADVVSAVVPIKSQEGLSSTAVETDDLWLPRRLTMTEAHELPATFGDADVGGELLLNTGLCVIDLRRPWVDDPEPLVFQTLNRIVVNDAGEYEAQVRSEDWEFSRAARARGARLYATRKVAPLHDGTQQYPSAFPWGTWKTDEIHAGRMAPA